MFVRAFEQVASLETLQNDTRNGFLSWVEDFMGESMMKEIAASDMHMQGVIIQILNGKYDLPFSRWGEGLVDVFVDMSKRSVVRRLGVTQARFRFDDNLSKKIQFVLQTENPGLSLGGDIDLLRQDINFRDLKLPPEHHYLERMMKMVAASVLHDILGRKKTRWRRNANDVDSVPVYVDSSTGVVVRTLPRRWYMLDEVALLRQHFEIQEPEALDKEVDITKRERKMAYVPAGVRRTRYGAVVEALIEELRSGKLSEEDYDTYLKEVRMLRDGTHPTKGRLAQADRVKLAALPKGFREETGPITDLDGKILYTRVFVAPHFNPRLPEGAYADLETLFKEAVYVSKGSAIAFMEVALANLAGLESEV